MQYCCLLIAFTKEEILKYTQACRHFAEYLCHCTRQVGKTMPANMKQWMGDFCGFQIKKKKKKTYHVNEEKEEA